MLLNICITRLGIVNIFKKELTRNCGGMAMNSDIANTPNRAHHLTHHVGANNVINKETKPKPVIKIERGMRAC